MIYSAAAVANFFLEQARLSSRVLDPMQLQKLVYFAHGWSLALAGRPLISEPIQAWDYGPVVPSLYQELKKYGSGPVTDPITDVQSTPTGSQLIEPRVSDVQTQNLLRRVWQVYGHLTGLQLSDLTHRPDTPWSIARRRPWRNNPISDASMREFFQKLAEVNAGRPGPAAAEI